MKKTLLYLSAATIIGILITIVPIITIAQIGIGENQKNGFNPSTLGQGVRQLDGDSSNTNANNSYVTVLAISFIIALAAFGLLGHHAPRRYNLRLGVPPY
jgi:hypothetical protein